MTSYVSIDAARSKPAPTVRTAPKAECPAESLSALAERFEREAMPYRAALLCTARRLTRREADAEDLIQDTMMNAFLGFDRFQPGTNLRAWLYRIMHNRWISVHRMKQRRPETFCVDAITDDGIAGFASRSNRFERSAEDEAMDGLSDHRIEEAFRSLPEGFQKVLYYVGVEDLTCADTAILLGIPVGTVMSACRGAAFDSAHSWQTSPTVRKPGQIAALLPNRHWTATRLRVMALGLRRVPAPRG